jgi:hypothetical protein
VVVFNGGLGIWVLLVKHLRLVFRKKMGLFFMASKIRDVDWSRSFELRL